MGTLKVKKNINYCSCSSGVSTWRGPHTRHSRGPVFNPSATELNPICHLITCSGGATIVVVGRLRVNEIYVNFFGVRDSSVGIATCYGLKGIGIDFQ
jgi:hypothetical protein